MEKVWKLIFGRAVRKAVLPRAEDNCRCMSPIRRLVPTTQTAD